ncbi:S41 family peptidase [Phaeodactylibacter sp.]|uniref:S41 family peptidase n=3 Tax=Phaeodactylibacter sp. TaxID=1940289 RepID=UPI0025FBD09F|nr:S41 family peptidase [Phaeodactylibacter sp.]MCI5090143.1 S41 family peptidase [Phaeodactylibacter sp.]
MKKLELILPIFLLLFTACNRDSNEPENISVENFLNEVVDIMERNSINRNNIDWADFRSQILNSGMAAQSVNQTDEALQLALELLGDNHSFIRRQNGRLVFGAAIDCQQSNVVVPNLPENIGYVRVSSFSGSINAAAIAFAEDIQAQIRNRDHQDIEGWIVDLRGNIGGNMWPMLAGIGPVLGEGLAGHFIDPNGVEEPWFYINGAARLNQNNIVSAPDPYELINPDPKVAVLLDRAVISSGEAIAIAFKGRANTRHFGAASCGLSTANTTFSLPDGSSLFLTTAYMADREKNLFGGPVMPDVPGGGSEMITAATDYILN